MILLLVQLNEGAAKERRERSLRYVDAYFNDPVSRHRQIVTVAWLRHRDLTDAINRGGGYDRAEIDQLARDVVKAYDAAHPAEPATLAVQSLAEFYDQVAICVAEKVCDDRIVDTYLGRGAREFWGTNQAVIKDLRPSIAPHLGERLEALVAPEGLR